MLAITALILSGCGGMAQTSNAPIATTEATTDGTIVGANPSLEHCTVPLGTLALDDGRNKDWYGAFGRATNVTTIEPLIRLAVQQSNCFIIPSIGNERLDNMMSAITDKQRNSGEYRAGSKQQKGQRVAADYFMEPTIVVDQSPTGRLAGAVGGALLGGRGSQLVGAGMESRGSVVTLSLFDIRSSAQIAISEGNSTATNFGAVLGAFGGGAAGGLGGFSQTPEGKATVAAFVDAYNSMVISLRNYKAQDVKGGLGRGGTIKLGEPGTKTEEKNQGRTKAKQLSSKAPGGLSLVCRTSKGICFAPAPEKPTTVCSCASKAGIIKGAIADTLPPETEVSLSTVVRVFYATDRANEGTVAAPIFGFKQGTVSFGTADVSIPVTHQTGHLEAPSQLVRIKFLENSKKHVIVLDVIPTDKDLFIQQLEARVSKGNRSEAFVFVHGFNVTFEDALRRTAQMAFDLGFDGAPILYSWPSRGSPLPLGYTADSQTVEWSRQILREFISELLVKSSAQNIYLIAHSMGNRPLVTALLSLFNEQPSLRNRIKEIVLAAPDIDANIFKRDIAPGLVKAGRPVTLYASSVDMAMRLSQIVSAGPRAGDSGDGLVVIDGVETIDASKVDVGFLGHSYFADTREVMTDLQVMFDQGLRAGQRAGLRQVLSSRPYWEFRK